MEILEITLVSKMRRYRVLNSDRLQGCSEKVITY